MKNYIFNSTRTYLLVLRYFLTIIISIFVVVVFFKFNLINKNFSFIAFLILFLIIYKLLKKISIITIIICTEGDHIKITQKHFFLKETLSDFKFSDIEMYLFENVTSYYKFKIVFKNAKKMLFLVETDVKNITEFNNFYSDFEETIIRLNLIKINKNSNIYQKKIGFFIVCLICLLLILIPVLYFLIEIKIKPPIILIIYSSGLLFLYRYYKEKN